MPSQRVSDGKIAGYGKQVYDTLAVDKQWRSRIAQEGVGYRRTDETGSSTSISMIWCPTAGLQPKGRTAKRPSEIKDLIGYGHPMPRPTQAQAPAPALPGPVPPPSASQRSQCSSRASNRSDTSINTAQLDSEGSRLQVRRRAPPLHESPPALRPPVTLPQPCLRTMTWALLANGDWGVGACSQAAAHERQVGQTYLRVGNLVEARKHLARAEQLLQIETPDVYDVPTTAAREHAHKSRLHGQGPSPARPPPRHAPDGSGRLSTYRGRARATARPPDASGS